MTTNTDKPKKLRNFSVSKNFSQVHTILDDIDKQERSRFICEAIIEKFNNMNKEQKSTEPMEQMKQMMEQYQMISSLINPVQQTMLNPAMVQMMQQPAYQQPIPDPAMLAQMQAQAYAQQVAQQVHTATPVQQPVQETPAVDTSQTDLSKMNETTIQDTGIVPQKSEEPVEENTSLLIENDDVNFKPQGLFDEDSAVVEKNPEETKTKSTPIPKEDERLQRRRRGGVTRQFM